MRVITAIYLHCKPELRDEWLCGGDVDGVVEEAVPLEQAGRGLVHWWHLRNFREVMEGTVSAHKNSAHNKSKRKEIGQNEEEDGDEQDEEEDEEETTDDFFARELERMGWGVNVNNGFNSGEDEDGLPGGNQGGGGGGEVVGQGGSDWDGGPLQLEGWA